MNCYIPGPLFWRRAARANVVNFITLLLHLFLNLNLHISRHGRAAFLSALSPAAWSRHSRASTTYWRGKRKHYKEILGRQDFRESRRVDPCKRAGLSFRGPREAGAQPCFGKRPGWCRRAKVVDREFAYADTLFRLASGRFPGFSETTTQEHSRSFPCGMDAVS